MLTLRRSECTRWLPPMERPSPSPVTTHTCRSGRAHRDAGGDGGSAPVDRVHAVDAHVVREAGRTTDARHEHHLLAAHVELGHQHLHRGEDRVVTATRAPTHLLVAGPVLLGGDGDGGARSSDQLQQGLLDLGRLERQALHLVHRLGVDQIAAADQQGELTRGSSRARAPRGSGRRPRRGCGGNGLRCTRWAWATFSPRARMRRTAAAIEP